MSNDDPDLMRLAGAVADGTHIDWAKALEATPDPALRAVMRQLQAIAGLATVKPLEAASSTQDETAEPAAELDRRSWGPLALRRKIGKGTFGTVYLAWDPSLEREVALKILGAAHKFEAVIREGRLLARVRHPNVVTVYGVDQFEGSIGLWMELVDGVTLKQLLQERGVFGAHEAALIGIDLCRAVGAVHQAGLLHRDIKTQNVMREAGGRILLMDFGGGAVRADEGLHRFTGTPLYLAPEVLLGQPATAASDIYSIGVLLYHLLTKRFPVEGESLADLETAHAQQRRTPLSDVRPDLPAGIVGVIERALHHAPGDRQRSVGAMQQDLLSTIAPDATRERLEVPAPTAGSAAAAKKSALTRRLVAAGIGAVAVVAAVAVLFFTRPPRSLVLGTPRQLTSASGWEAEPVIGPEGHFVAYTSDQSGTGNSDIWLLDSLTGASLQLTNDPAPDHSPAWLPDGSAILFVSERGGRSAIWKTARLGGPASLVVEDAEDPAVSPDGSTLAYVHRDGGGQYQVLVAPLSDPTRSKALTTGRLGTWDHRHPAWSPDGQRLVYQGLRDLWVASVADGRESKLTSADAADRDPVWSPDGKFVYFSSNRSGTTVLWRVPAAGGQAVPLTGGQGPERQPSLSADGSRLVFSTLDENPNLIIRDLQSAGETRLESNRRENSPVFSPDGASLVYVSDRWAGRFDLWSQLLVQGAPSGEPRRLTDQTGSVSAPAYSPDGRWIAYYRVLQGQRDIWIVPTGGGVPIQFTDDPAADVQPDWSPDGRTLVFLSGRSGTDQIWTQPIAEGHPAGVAQRITNGAAVGGTPTWSPDGTTVAYVGSDSEAWLADPAGKKPARKVTTGANLLRLVWNRQSGSLWAYGTWQSDVPTIRMLDMETGNARPLTPPILLSRTTSPDFDLSWDGRRLAYTREMRRGDLWIHEARGNTF